MQAVGQTRKSRNVGEYLSRLKIYCFHDIFHSTRTRHRAVRFRNKRKKQERDETRRNIEFYRNEPRLIRIVLIKLNIISYPEI